MALLLLSPLMFLRDIKAAEWVEPTTYTEIDTIEELVESSGNGSAFYQNGYPRIWFFDTNGNAYLYNLKSNFNNTLLMDAEAAYIAETSVDPAYMIIKPQLQDVYYLTWTYNHGVGAIVEFQYAIANAQQQITSYWSDEYTVTNAHGLGFIDNISPLLDGAGSLVASNNLFKLTTGTNTVKGVEISIDDNDIITLNGTTTSNVNYADLVPKVTTFTTGNQYSVSYSYLSGIISTGSIAVNDSDSNIIVRSNTAYITSISKTENISSNYIYLWISTGATFDNFKFRIQVESGSSVTPWMHPDSIYYSTASIQHDQAPDSVTTIMSNVYAYDDVDGNITDRFQVVDTSREYAAVLANKWKLNVNEVLSAYDSNTLNEVNTNTITLTKAYVDAEFATYQSGTYWYNYDNDSLEALGLTTPYKFLVYVGDTAGNYSFLEINVFINDVTAPYFHVSNVTSYDIGYKETFDLTTFVSSLVVYDNYDDSVELNIITDNYTANKTVLGEYTVIVRATDDTGNFSEKTFYIEVVDNVKPVINGPEEIFKPLSGTMTINDVKLRFTAFDEISGNVTSRITVDVDNYTGYGHIPGTYYVTLRVTDITGNYEYYTFPIIVRDDIPPVIYVADGYFIQLSTAYNLTLEGIKNILVATGRLSIVATTTYTVLVDEYTGNESIPGVYTISIRFDSTSGVSEVHSVSLNVVNTSLTDGVINVSRGINPMFIVFGLVGLVGVVILVKRKN